MTIVFVLLPLAFYLAEQFSKLSLKIFNNDLYDILLVVFIILSIVGSLFAFKKKLNNKKCLITAGIGAVLRYCDKIYISHSKNSFTNWSWNVNKYLPFFNICLF